MSLVNTKTGQKNVVQADAQGQFTFTGVPVGQYRLDANANGFSETLTHPFAVAVAARQRVDVALQPGKQTETVTVSGAASLLESESSETRCNE